MLLHAEPKATRLRENPASELMLLEPRLRISSAWSPWMVTCTGVVVPDIEAGGGVGVGTGDAW